MPKTSDAVEPGLSGDHTSYNTSMSTTCPPIPGSMDAGSIPEHLRGVSSHDGRMTITSPNTRPFLNTRNRHTNAYTRHTHLPTRPGANRHPSGSYSREEDTLSRNHALLQLQHDSGLSSTGTSTTATTRQPEPLSAFSMHPLQSIHNRLSQSSPSLSPICHENYSGVPPEVEDSFVEDFDSLSCDIYEGDPVRFRTVSPRSIREDQLKTLPFSVSTPCLVHMQKILPSCAKKLNCVSSSVPVKHVYSDKSIPKPNSLSSNLESSRHKLQDANIHNTGTFVNSKSCSPPIGSKRPGKVVMVISQPGSCREPNKLREEKMHLVSRFSVTGKREDSQKKVSDRQPTLFDRFKTFESEVGDIQVGPQEIDDETRKCGNDSKNHCHQRCSSQSQHNQRLLKAHNTSLKIERQVQHAHWRMLAPLARVLNFAYSQVVNAMLSIQREESSISSGSHHSRASSFSKEIFASRPSSPVARLDTLWPKDNTQKSQHKREMSQLSLAGSALSSDSFEILDLPEIDSSNFVYVGGDSLSCDVLHEYHLFPSKRSLFTQSPQSECSTPVSHPGAIFTTPFPVCSPGSKECKLMSSSSADFAHFDFSELISNRHLNKLNPAEYESTKDRVISAHRKVWGWEIERSHTDDAMIDSFVVLEGDRSMLVCNSGMDDCTNEPVSSGSLIERECDDESVTSNGGSESASFSVVSESEFNDKA